jgi:hypothetical protein
MNVQGGFGGSRGMIGWYGGFRSRISEAIIRLASPSLSDVRAAPRGAPAVQALRFRPLSPGGDKQVQCQIEREARL